MAVSVLPCSCQGRDLNAFIYHPLLLCNNSEMCDIYKVHGIAPMWNPTPFKSTFPDRTWGWWMPHVKIGLKRLLILKIPLQKVWHAGKILTDIQINSEKNLFCTSDWLEQRIGEAPRHYSLTLWEKTRRPCLSFQAKHISSKRGFGARANASSQTAITWWPRARYGRILLTDLTKGAVSRLNLGFFWTTA